MWHAMHAASFASLMIAICSAYYYPVVAKYAFRGIFIHGFNLLNKLSPAALI